MTKKRYIFWDTWYLLPFVELTTGRKWEIRMGWLHVHWTFSK